MRSRVVFFSRLSSVNVKGFTRSSSLRLKLALLFIEKENVSF